MVVPCPWLWGLCCELVGKGWGELALNTSCFAPAIKGRAKSLARKFPIPKSVSSRRVQRTGPREGFGQSRAGSLEIGR